MSLVGTYSTYLHLFQSWQKNLGLIIDITESAFKIRMIKVYTNNIALYVNAIYKNNKY